METKTLPLTNFGHDDGGGDAPPLSTVRQLRRVTSGGEKLAVAEAQKMELVDRVVWLPRDCSLGEEGLGKLQRGFDNCALQKQNVNGVKPGIPAASTLQEPQTLWISDLVQQAGERACHVAFEGELAVLPCRALGARPLEQHAGHTVPVISPDGVRLQRDVGGRLEEQNMNQPVQKPNKVGLFYLRDQVLDKPGKRPVQWSGGTRRSFGGK